MARKGGNVARNVIVLTVGLSGSSVLTGLLVRGGYWTGPTMKKPDYDTYENEELVALNRSVLQAAAFKGRYELVYDPRYITQVEAVADQLDAAPFLDFIKRCNE